jgi:hypothetical protein
MLVEKIFKLRYFRFSELNFRIGFTVFSKRSIIYFTGNKNERRINFITILQSSVAFPLSRLSVDKKSKESDIVSSISFAI